MTEIVGRRAPDFAAEGVLNGTFRTHRLSDYAGKWVVLFFYPLDFTFVCPTEILAFSDRLAEFKKLGAEVLGVSVDSKFSHLAWTEKPRAEGGIQGLAYPLLEDLKKEIAAAYGVLAEGNAVALRGLFLNTPVRVQGLGRNVDVGAPASCSISCANRRANRGDSDPASRASILPVSGRDGRSPHGCS